MRPQTTVYLIIASGVAMAILIAFQVSWMRHSQQLLEKQFNSKVQTALCNAVEEVAKQESCVKPFRSDCRMTAKECTKELNALIQRKEFEQALSKSLATYNIDIPYQARICSKPEAKARPVTCTLDPLTATDEHFVNLEFKGQTQYVLNQMGFMTGTSFGILLLLGIVFGYATYQLLKQQRMSRLNQEFFNHMAHEFRTPLTNIKLAGNLLERKANLPPNQPHLSIIRHEAAQLMQQVEQVLYLARIEKEDYLLKREPLDLVALVQETIDAMRLQVDERDARLSFTPTCFRIPFQGDPLQLRSAIRNLIDNALKYAGPTPYIRIDLQEQADRIVLLFADNGPGFTVEQIPHIFQMYHRCKTESNTKGFGLGLAYVKRVIELHGGTIQLRSAPGTGACFECNLPKS